MSRRIGQRAKEKMRDVQRGASNVKREASNYGKSFAYGAGGKLAGMGVAAAAANPVVALIIIGIAIALIVGLSIWFTISLATIFMNPLLWGICLIIVGLLRPRTAGTLGFSVATGLIMWLITVVFPAVTAAANNWVCKLWGIGPIVCGLWYGTGILGGLIKSLTVYVVAAYLIIYSLGFLDKYLEARY